jgi:hypothetical protein
MKTIKPALLSFALVSPFMSGGVIAQQATTENEQQTTAQATTQTSKSASKFIINAPTFYGSLGVSLALELAAEAALALEDSPGDVNFLGLSGSVGLHDGSRLTYLHEEIIQLTGAGGLQGANQSYVGYQRSNYEVRIGYQDLPLRRAMDKANIFAGTYADQYNVVIANTIASSSALFLGQSEGLHYVASIDFGAAGAENANNEDAIVDAIRLGGMADLALTDQLSLAGGIEVLLDDSVGYNAIGASINLALNDSIDLTGTFSRVDFEAGNAPITITAGGTMDLGKKLSAKALIGLQDTDSAADTASMIALGLDKVIADPLVIYGLIAIGNKGGLRGSYFPNGSSPLEADSSGKAQVLSIGAKFTF